MNSNDPVVIESEHSRLVTGDDITVELCIYRLDTGNEWTLELVTQDNSSIVWEEAFESDDAANAEFEKALVDVGLHALINDADEASLPQA